jgi:DNA repair protein RAD5
MTDAACYTPTVLRREKKMRDKDGNPIVSLPEKHIDIAHLDFSKDEREIYNALFQNAKSKFLGYAKEGTVLQNVTAIFSILMRLRQAVLHPSLVLKRLKENLRIRQAQRAAGHVNSEDADGGSGQAGPIEDVAIQRMIERYIAGSADAGSEAAASQVIDEMLDIDSSHGVKPELGECMLCMEVSSRMAESCRDVVALNSFIFRQPVEVPVWMPVCQHIGCKACVLQHLTDCQDAGESVRVIQASLESTC